MEQFTGKKLPAPGAEQPDQQGPKSAPDGAANDNGPDRKPFDASRFDAVQDGRKRAEFDASGFDIEKPFRSIRKGTYEARPG